MHGLYWGVLAWGRGSMDQVQQGRTNMTKGHYSPVRLQESEISK